MTSKAVLRPGIHRQRFKIGETRETKLLQPSKEAIGLFPYFQLLPKDPVELLKWKIYVRKRCLHDDEFRQDIWNACKKDCAFFAATFCWIFEPRPPRPLPFSPWVDQVDLLAWLTECFGERNVSICKTRGIGVSWLLSVFFYWCWLFHPGVKLGVMTKDKDSLDGVDENTTIGKFVYLHEHMPYWVRFDGDDKPTLDRDKGSTSITNRRNSAIIQGFVCTNKKMRQFRFTALWADEFAFFERDAQEWMVSSGATTHCRIMSSTWNDFDDMFHHIVYEEQSMMLKTFSFWHNNYERWKGAYKIVNGIVEYVDKKYMHPKGYEFGVPDIIPEGTLRSPWVDNELSQPGVDQYKALRDIYGMTVCKRHNSFFDPNTQVAVEESTNLTPMTEGALDTNNMEVRITPTTKSNIRLWFDPATTDRGPYKAGCDLGQGVGRSHSVMQVIDSGGEQVLEFGTNELDIVAFASNCAKLARWLNGDHGDGWTEIDFEANGQQAKPFYTELERLGYGNITTTRKKGRVPRGFSQNYHGTRNTDAGYSNFRQMERAIMELECVVKSKRVAGEMKVCGKDDGGQPSFPKMNMEGHGDYTHALGIAWNRAKDEATVDNRAQHSTAQPQEKQEAVFAAQPSLWSDTWRR